jgi:hypothetical protein
MNRKKNPEGLEISSDMMNEMKPIIFLTIWDIDNSMIFEKIVIYSLV